MSRRFGRNQKRRLRAEVAAAQEEAIHQAGLASRHAEGKQLADAACARAHDRETDMRLMLEATAIIVGRQALAAGIPTNFEADWLKHGKKNFRLRAPMFVSDTPSYGVQRGETAIMVHDEIMRLLEVEAIRRPVSRMMQVLVTFDNIPIGYALSDNALHSMPETLLADRIAREMRPLLVNAIQELKGRRK